MMCRCSSSPDFSVMIIMSMLWLPGRLDPASSALSAANVSRRTSTQFMFHLWSKASIDQSALKHTEEDEQVRPHGSLHVRETGLYSVTSFSTGPSLLVRGPELSSGVLSQKKCNSDDDVFKI